MIVQGHRDHPGHIGGAIATVRAQAGLSQVDLARLCGIHHRTLSRHERGLSKSIAGLLVERIALVCGRTAQELWQMAEEAPLVRRTRGRPGQVVRRSNHEPWEDYEARYKRQVNTARHRHKARAHGVSATFTEQEWQYMLQLYDHRCAYCGLRAKGTLSQDHIVPISQGGGYTWENIVPACKHCNPSKGDRPAPLFQPVLPLRPGT